MLLDNRLFTRFAQLAQLLRAGAALLAIGLCVQQYLMAQEALQGRFPAPCTSAAQDRQSELAMLLQLGATILAFLTLAAWMYRAYQNAHRLPGARPSHGPSMAVWGWLIPIANFWYPCRIMNEIGLYTGRYAQPAEPPLSATGWANLVGVWWVLHIGSYIMSYVANTLTSAAADNLEQLLVYDRMLLFSHLLSFGNAVATLVLLRLIAPYEQRLLVPQ
ncbi:DUF4328 domain-containing protein [Hymenobacter sp. APR13]|uniref:DUF4328 domain-containing protein n=1 Tax=Hymenobacter sp. APR13 TaxID=1356852 RepID=UPI0004E08194|nr:DUF4328 domain-containing protein [Hymenobacter sp. APR13]AII53643.1 hypothetical protein N008_16890 [Hymenobacter sp. APR13]